MKRNISGIVYATNQIPADYKCDCCGAHGVKLWREFGADPEKTKLLCFEHVKTEVQKNIKSEWQGSWIEAENSVWIGWYISAIPKEGENSYWGHSTKSHDGFDWWKNLPTKVLEVSTL
jgi:hypothetical protein